MTIHDAQIFLQNHGDITIIILDGMVPQHPLEGMPCGTLLFAKFVVLQYPKITLIAASSDDLLNEELLVAGCIYSVRNK